jgi:hypothetical protein
MSPKNEGDSVDTQLGIINTKLDILIEQRHDQEQRIRGLEQFKWLMVGAAFSGGGVAGGVVAKILG